MESSVHCCLSTITCSIYEYVDGDQKQACAYSMFMQIDEGHRHACKFVLTTKVPPEHEGWGSSSTHI